MIDVQRGITFDQGMRSAEIITKKLSATPAPIPDLAHLLMLLFSGAFLAATFLLFSTDIQHKTTLGIAALTISLGLGVAAFWRFRKRR
ncbi:MAG: hypothetical protein WA609_05375 [Terriglobales bacterium]